MKKTVTFLSLCLITLLLFTACTTSVPPVAERSAPISATNLQSTQTQEPDFITKDQALDFLLKHAQISLETISDLEIELDYDDDRRQWEYDISFDIGITEYEGEVNAVDGTVIQFKKDW